MNANVRTMLTAVNGMFDGCLLRSLQLRQILRFQRDSIKRKKRGEKTQIESLLELTFAKLHFQKMWDLGMTD